MIYSRSRLWKKQINHEEHEEHEVFLKISSCSSCSSWLIKIFIFALFLFVVASCSAQDDSDEQPPPPPVKKPTHWQWNLSIINRTGFRLDEPRVFQMSRTIANGKGIYRFNDRWRLTLECRAQYDPVNRLGYSKLWLDPRQILLDGKIKKVSLSLGLQQVVWG